MGEATIIGRRRVIQEHSGTPAEIQSKPKADRQVTKSKKDGDEPITIKKYANRRLYNTATSSYVTLENLADMVKEGVNFQVFDAKSGE